MRRRFGRAASMRRWTLALCLLCAPTACAEDLAARLEREFGRLGSDSTAERDAAQEAISKEGTAALAPVRARLAVEKDPEVLARLQLVCRTIEKRALGARSWATLWRAQPVAARICGVRLSPDGKLAATIGGDGCIHILDVGARRLIHTIENLAADWKNDFRFTTDGALLICTAEGIDNVHLRAWRTSDGTEVGPFEEADVLFDFDTRLYSGPQGLAALVSPRMDNCAATIRCVWDGRGVAACTGPGVS